MSTQQQRCETDYSRSARIIWKRLWDISSFPSFFSFSFLFFLVGSCWMSRTLLRTSWYLTPSVPSRGVVASNLSHANVRNSNDGIHQRTMVGMMQRNGQSWNRNQTGFSLSESVLQMTQSRTLLLDTAILGTYLKMAVPPPSLLPLPWYLHHMAVAVLFMNDLIICYIFILSTQVLHAGRALGRNDWHADTLRIRLADCFQDSAQRYYSAEDNAHVLFVCLFGNRAFLY